MGCCESREREKHHFKRVVADRKLGMYRFTLPWGFRADTLDAIKSIEQMRAKSQE